MRSPEICQGCRKGSGHCVGIDGTGKWDCDAARPRTRQAADAFAHSRWPAKRWIVRNCDSEGCRLGGRRGSIKLAVARDLYNDVALQTAPADPKNDTGEIPGVER